MNVWHWMSCGGVAFVATVSGVMTLVAQPAQASAAQAANQHAPGGIVSLAVLFFLLLLGSKLAGALKEKCQPACLPGVILYFVSVALACLGGIAAACALVYIVVYGIVRSVQAVRRGEGAKKFAIALAMLVLIVALVADYAASRVAETRSSESQSETENVVAALKTVASAEKAVHAAPALSDHAANSYAGVDFLLKYRLVDKGFEGGVPRNGYLFHLQLSADGQHYIAWAVPANYKGSHSDARQWLPGVSLYGFLHPVNRAITEPGGVLSVSLDEKGMLRAQDQKGRTAATAEEAAAWPELNPEK